MKEIKPVTLHTLGKASYIAKLNSLNDSDWTYTVTSFGALYAVAVRDEEGVLLGYL